MRVIGSEKLPISTREWLEYRNLSVLNRLKPVEDIYAIRNPSFQDVVCAAVSSARVNNWELAFFSTYIHAWYGFTSGQQCHDFLQQLSDADRLLYEQAETWIVYKAGERSRMQENSSPRVAQRHAVQVMQPRKDIGLGILCGGLLLLLLLIAASC